MDYEYAGYGLTMAFSRMPCDLRPISLGSPSVIVSRYDGPTAFRMRTEGFFASRVQSSSPFTVAVDDDRHQFAGEALMLVGPRRCVSCDFTGPLEGQFISMTPESVSAIMGSAIEVPTSLHSADDLTGAWHLMRAVAAIVETDKIVDPLIFGSIVDAVLRLIVTPATRDPKRMPALSVQQACAVRAMIVDGLSGNLRIADLAQSLDLSEGHFARAFKESFGTSPYNYILRERVMLAQKLIVEGKTSLASVAESTGFHNLARMTRALKAHLGQTARATRAARPRATVRTPTIPVQQTADG